ncbi:hypothetical protein PVV74_10295 [Roseovarius sp. SK2]|uniref:hypothetical protein n=1 Tax=Roseovarius TaxID=74030 RepID=UPI00237A1FFC|nr:hypothetical protein [Roseovarius sp. SK2]MDD9725844.1 hypothetical protein [Roseovarius sp. SK2]
MRHIPNSRKKRYLKELDDTLAARVRVEAYEDQVEQLARQCRRGRLDKATRTRTVKDLLNITCATDDPHVVSRRARAYEKQTTGTALRLFADEENSRSREESTKYGVMSFRYTVAREAAVLFVGYVPFRITRHALIRLMERSQIAYNQVSAANFGMAEIAQSLAHIIPYLPVFVLGNMASGHYHFGIRIADGILLCNLFEETTYYEASYRLVSKYGVAHHHGRSVFGNPEDGVSRVVLAKTWIGPEEIRPGQAELITQVEAVMARKRRLAASFMDADLYRSPNWIDDDLPDYVSSPTQEITDLAVEVAQIMRSDAYHREFVPRER